MSEDKRLIEQLERQVKRMKKAEKERDTLLSHATYIGVLGLVLVLPIIAGAYLGVWLDSRAEDYSVRWTLGCILLGLVIGILNVYFLQRNHDNGR